jgi:ABC-2 type transport system permease protein
MESRVGKLWRVMRHEYVKAVRRRTFILSTLGLPFVFVVIVALSVLAASAGSDARGEKARERRPTGLVDRSGLLVAFAPAGLRAFPDVASAQAALTTGEVAGYYVVPPDYEATGKVELYYRARPPDETARAALESALRAALGATQTEDVRRRLASSLDLAVRSLDGRREISEATLINLILPFVAGLLFSFSTMNSAGYMVQAVATEKENRTAEVLASTVTPFELVGGKALGLMGVALTQLLIWLGLAAAPLGGVLLYLDWAARVRVPWGFLGLAALFFLPAYALMAGIMTAIGSIVDEAHQGQQIAGTLNLVFVVPFFFVPVVFAEPNSPVLVAMTLFPTTAYITILMRWSVTVIPTWQLILSFVMLTTSAALSLWAAARIFRRSMLRYGLSLDLRTVWRTLRAAG